MSDLTRNILAQRGPKNAVNLWQAYAQFAEVERGPTGDVQSFVTILLTNRECAFRCAMCDLWKNTSDLPTPRNAIPRQIQHALQSLAPADNIKLYNSGNFFDRRAIPVEDHLAIAQLLSSFGRVVVENHPKLTDQRCVEFSKLLTAQLEIALGLETIHPVALADLNKGMDVGDFDRAAEFLRQNRIDVRTFILIQPPGLQEEEGVEWAVRSVAHALRAGAHVCSLIPVRSGNGYVDSLIDKGEYSEPRFDSIETAFSQALELDLPGRVFIDLWDIQRFSQCSHCLQQRIERLQRMNLTQLVSAKITCEHCS